MSRHVLAMVLLLAALGCSAAAQEVLPNNPESFQDTHIANIPTVVSVPDSVVDTLVQPVTVDTVVVDTVKDTMLPAMIILETELEINPEPELKSEPELTPVSVPEPAQDTLQPEPEFIPVSEPEPAQDTVQPEPEFIPVSEPEPAQDTVQPEPELTPVSDPEPAQDTVQPEPELTPVSVSEPAQDTVQPEPEPVLAPKQEPVAAPVTKPTGSKGAGRLQENVRYSAHAFLMEDVDSVPVYTVEQLKDDKKGNQISHIIVRPNPVSDNLIVQLRKSTYGARYDLMRISDSRMIASGEWKGMCTRVPLDGCTRGDYLLNIIDVTTGQQCTYKVTKTFKAVEGRK